MRVVVTGASGFLGGFVVRALERLPSVEVVAVSRRAMPGAVRVADYRDTPRGDALVHLAQEALRARVQAESPRHEGEALAALDALLEKGFTRTIFASSGALYGDRDARPRTPADPVAASDPYAKLKSESEARVVRRGGVAARLANLYGPGMSGATVLGTILAQIPGSGPVRVQDTAPIRDFLWVADAAEAIAAMGADAGTKGEGRVVNLGTGIGTSIGDAARLALEIAGEGGREVVSTGAPRASAIVLDNSDVRGLYGWTPRTTLRAGLTQLLERVTNHP